ncbi:MAG: hypothetical protein GY826_15665, partial [Fuerstiella sp.]|nr:hypothetical protein [Fuerstiella sp.]
QYVLGGFFRHLGRMLHEHLAGALIVSLLAVVLLTARRRSDLLARRRRGRWLGLAILIQIGLGLGSWVTKLGFPTFGWVASANSPAQNVVCSLHTVGGMFLLATAAAAAAELLLRARSGQIAELTALFSESPLSSGRNGGLA